MINDSISDFLTRIRNANLVCRKKVLVPSTKINKRLAKILVRHGFISDFQQINKPSTKKLNKVLKSSHNGQSLLLTLKKNQPRVILQLQRLSRPGCRLYVRARNLPNFGKLGIVLLSTSKGILSDREAYPLNVGGEILGFIS